MEAASCFRRCRGVQGRMSDGAPIFAPSIWSGSTCDAKPGSTFAMLCALLVPGGAKIGAPPGILPPDPADLLRPRAGPEEAPGFLLNFFVLSPKGLLQIAGN